MAKSHSTISTYQMLDLVPDEATARLYIESRRWPDEPRCPVCGFGDRITTRKRAGYYRCNSCKEDFTVRTGTIFERSHVPLRKWLHAMYLLLTARKGISSLQLSKQISVTQKTAWLMLRRLRAAATWTNCAARQRSEQARLEKTPCGSEAPGSLRQRIRVSAQ